MNFGSIHQLLLLVVLLLSNQFDVCSTMTTKIINNKKTISPLIDIGINLGNRQFNRDREEVIQRAAQNGVTALILTGCSVRGSIEAQKYCDQFAAKSQHSTSTAANAAAAAASGIQLLSTAGVHPHDAKSCNDDTLSILRRLAQSQYVVAIGECGLDYNRNFSPPEVQRTWFEHQLQLACELNMPVFLHERDAHEDFFRILKQYSDKLPACVVHCFTGTQKELEAYLTIPNCYIGITGWICDERRGLHLRNSVPLIPDDKLMIETDAPFLFPRDLPLDKRVTTNKKDRRNEPSYLGHVCHAVATCRGQTSDHVAEITTANAIRFFGLPLQLSSITINQTPPSASALPGPF